MRNLQRLTSDEDGQALVEYILILAMVVAVMSAAAIGLRRTLFKVWKGFAREVSGACPGCPADPQIR